jgi:hypothetical protein
MKAFRFPLEKALDLRRTQLTMAESRYRQQLAEVGALDRSRAEAEASGIRAELEIRQNTSVRGSDLAALDRFRLRVKKDEVRIAAQRETAVGELSARQDVMLLARRRSKLLERLRERRLKDWQADRDRELEEVASESYLAQWSRRRDA